MIPKGNSKESLGALKSKCTIGEPYGALPNPLSTRKVEKAEIQQHSKLKYQDIETTTRRLKISHNNF